MERLLGSTIVALAVAAHASAVAAQPTFTRSTVASVTGARGVATGDFDRNGLVDVALANAGRNTVVVLLNRGGVLSRAYEVAVGAGPFGIATGDFNRDGILDLAVVNADANSISLLAGRGNGNFTRAATIPTGETTSPRGIAAADIDGDGVLDLAVTGFTSGSLQVFVGTGAGGFTKRSTALATLPRPQGIAAADLNRDGRVDLVVAADGNAGLEVFYGSSPTTFSSARLVAGSTRLNVLTVADLNNDGWLDVAAASTINGTLTTFAGSSSGLRATRTYSTPAGPRGIIAADLDVDGLTDVVTANYDAGNVTAFLGDRSSPGTLRRQPSLPAASGSRAVAAIDVDHDGHLDVVAGNQGAAFVTLFHNDIDPGTAAFSFTTATRGAAASVIGGGSQRAYAVDVNRDGRDDLITLGEQPRTVTILIDRGATVALTHSGAFLDGWLVGDFNHDGNADVLMKSSQPDTTIETFLGDGRGTFRRSAPTTSPLQLRSFAAGDLNGDAWPDLVFSGFDPVLRTPVIAVFLGNGDGTFSPLPSAPIAGEAAALTIADLDRDGRGDVAALTYPSGLLVYRGDGLGALEFRDVLDVVLDNILTSLDVADLNDDGRPDLIAASDQQIATVLASATGFEPAAYTASAYRGGSNNGLGIADLNDDGRLDVVTDQGALWLGDGTGRLGEPALFDFGDLASGVTVRDVNHDGVPDLVVGGAWGTAAVALNQRGTINHPPAVSVVDRTFAYADQFGDDALEIQAAGRDPDSHALSYEWTDDGGRVVGGERWLTLPILQPGSYHFTVTARDGRGGEGRATATITVTQTTEIVLYTADPIIAQGVRWAAVDDVSAAGGWRAYNRNIGQAVTAAPRPQTADGVFVEFVADPTVAYKLWMRLRADSDRWDNDSVWVQFSGAADTAGQPISRIGTAAGLAVSLEPCAGCGLQGWGWEDDGWGAPERAGALLRFPAGGAQQLFIQTREDGVSIDQIVLSGAKYLTSRPGQARNDATILTRTFFQY